MNDIAQAKDAREAIARWRDAQPVQVVSMGGLSDAYERGIWEIAFAALEAMLDNPPDEGWNSFDDDDKWERYRDMIERTPVVTRAVEDTAPSGAMFGAGLSAAAVLAKNGYREGLAMAPADRLIVMTRQSKWEPAAEGPGFR